MMENRRPANDEMVEGYRDGLDDEREEMPESLSNRTHAYRHGWLNGRDDRLRRPRGATSAIAEAANQAMRKDEGEML